MYKYALSAALAAVPLAGMAEELTPVTFGTNWLAQAEHGGFYQSVADGTYAECGLDVTIVSGGPQVNNRALLLADRIQYHMGGDMLQAFNAVAEEIPVVAVAAIFQKHPQVIVAHPDVESWEDLKDKTLLIGDNGYTSYYQWMIAAHGFTAEQREPYTFNPAPFIANTDTAMQGYLSSEPYLVQKEAGFEPNVFLIADNGYSSYATTIEVMQSTIDENPEQVECFVDASLTGWYNYLYGDSAAADALILEANADMTQDKIDFAKNMMRDQGIVDSGKTLELGIGAMSDEVIGDFYQKMVDAGVIGDDLDWKAAYTLDFTNKKVGMDIKP
ncbi:ABC transporter substrate-binding protein [Tateyamaria sp. syn59]|uniref:ABC transporter substrate-binding protein n=1 Tax=Tateyamaria sp. syn59 TaxID=2576942 RepID=UPI0011BF45CB|nr:ABC transporter substrate-binding protein [Tateyamaria sp. syn59]